MRQHLAAIALLVLVSSAAVSHADVGEHASILGAAGFGGGSLKPGGLYASASAEAQVWLSSIGLGARVSTFATGAPDGGGGTGHAFVALVSARLAVAESTDARAWAIASMGIGPGTVSGYTGRVRGDGDFEVKALTLQPRVGVLGAYRFVAGGFALESTIVRGGGFAIAPVLTFGFVL